MSSFEIKDRIAKQHLIVLGASLIMMFSFGAGTSFADWSAYPALAVWLAFTAINLLVLGFRWLNVK